MTSTEQKIERFIAALTSLGGSAGNQRLREELGWQDSTYQRIKQQLIDDGRIRAGRGEVDQLPWRRQKRRLCLT